MIGFSQLIQVHSIALCIALGIIRKFWVGILIVCNVDMTSTLDTSGDGGEFLVGLERLAMWTLCCYIPRCDSLGLARFPSTEAIES